MMITDAWYLADVAHQPPELHRQLPNADCFALGCQSLSGLDRQLLAIYSALVAGTVALMLREDCGGWALLFLLAGLVCFMVGLGATVVHLQVSGEILTLIGWMQAGVLDLALPEGISVSLPEKMSQLQQTSARAWRGVLASFINGLFWTGVGFVILVFG